jgi:hypothetical protein
VRSIYKQHGPSPTLRKLGGLRVLCEPPGGLAVAAILVLLTLIASQDFYLAHYESATALKSWWIDASFHVTNINALAATLQGQVLPGGSDTGVASGFYHFLSYLPSALACVLFGLHPIKAFALIYAPLSIFLFSYGIWLIVASCWPKEITLWATAFFLLLPDSIPYVYSSHEFLRLKWLVAVSPGLGYGVFVSALAWILCLRGIRTSRPSLVAAGWLVCLLTVIVKGHLFVANALPLVVYTLTCYPGIERRQRYGLIALFFIAYASATFFAGRILSIPLIRLDFSNAAAYAATLATFAPLDAITGFAMRTTARFPGALAPAGLALALLFAHFGLLFLMLVLYRVGSDVSHGEIDRWLPALAIFGVYLLHAVGLAADSRHYAYSGEPIELIHRPFVWGVSLVTVWTFASLATHKPQWFSLRRRWGMSLLLLPMSLYVYHNFQFAPRWLAPHVEYSPAYFDALAFVAHQSDRRDLVQASDLDPYLVTQAATGRAPYAAKYAMRLYPSQDVVTHCNEVIAWFNANDVKQIEDFAAHRNIRWLLLDRTAALRWPADFVSQHTVFNKNGVVVICLGSASDMPANR